MSRRLLRVLIEVEGEAFDPNAANPYADTQAELEAVLSSNLQTITSMDAGDVITLRDTSGNRCGKVEMEDFPGSEPLLPYWARLSDLALEVEDEFPVAAFVEKAVNPLYVGDAEGNVRPARIEGSGQKTERPEPTVTQNDEEAARAFDEGELAYPGTPGSHEHIAERDPGDPVIPTRPRTTRPPQPGRPTANANVPPPPGDPSMR